MCLHTQPCSHNERLITVLCNLAVALHSIACRLANGWFGPPGQNGPIDQVFAVRVHLNLSSTPVPPPPPPPVPPAPPPPSKPLINITKATYAGNCCNGTCAGNFDDPVRARCDGEPRCNFTIVTPTVDPCPFHQKSFVAEFTCQSGGVLRTDSIGGEASGQTIYLACT